MDNFSYQSTTNIVKNSTSYFDNTIMSDCVGLTGRSYTRNTIPCTTYDGYIPESDINLLLLRGEKRK